jgi:Glyoxalase-like domain
MLAIDHVVIVVPDAEEMRVTLRARFGLGCETGPYHDFAGTRNHSVPIRPPAYVEFLTIENRRIAGSTDAGRRVLECEAAGYGFLAWAVRADDLESVSRRLDVPVVDRTIAQPDGTLRGWRSVSGPSHLPFFIDYPNNGDRLGRWDLMYERVRHTSSPGAFSQLTLGGSEDEMMRWLGPNDLPLRFAEGAAALRSVRIEAQPSDITISWPL